VVLSKGTRSPQLRGIATLRQVALYGNENALALRACRRAFACSAAWRGCFRRYHVDLVERRRGGGRRGSTRHGRGPPGLRQVAPTCGFTAGTGWRCPGVVLRPLNRGRAHVSHRFPVILDGEPVPRTDAVWLTSW